MRQKFNIGDYKDIRLRIFIIGYSDQGESIVVLFMDKEENVFYTIVIDCYAKDELNKTMELLDKFNIHNHIDLLCWSHPDRDHTLGIDSLIDKYCDDKSFIFVPFGIEGNENDCVSYNNGDKEIVDKIFALNSRLHKAFKPVGCPEESSLQLPGFDFCSLLEKSLPVRIYALSPLSEYIADAKRRYTENGKYIHKNLFAISLCMIVGENYYFHFCSDIENSTIAHMNQDFFEKATFVKIPHHSSKGSSKLLGLLPANKFISCSTTFTPSNLPHQEILELYEKRSSNLHWTGIPSDGQKLGYGIIEYTFDLFGEHVVDIKLHGNARKFSDNIN